MTRLISLVLSFVTVLIIVMVVVASPARVEAAVSKASAQRSKFGTLKGRVAATKNNGDIVPPESATVYVLFSAAMEGESFTHAEDIDTAGGQFTYQLRKLLDENKKLKNLEKSVRHNPPSEMVEQISTYYLQGVDEALARVRSWLTKHADRTWQVETIAPDAQGFWAVEGLRPGGYEIVVRGTISGYDADWEGGVDLAPDKIISLPLTQPRFLRHK